MSANTYSSEISKQTLLNMASITVFMHVLCGLLRYLTDIRFVLALDYASTGCFTAFALTYCVKHKAKPLNDLLGRKEHVLLLALLGWFVIAQLANVIFRGAKSAYFAPNALHDVLLLFFVFFPYGRHIARFGVPHLGKRLFEVLLITWSLFILYVLTNAFLNRVVVLPGNIELGMYGTGTFRLNNNPNHTSCFEFVFLCLCCLMSYTSKKRSSRIMYICFCVIHYIGMVLSNSRTFLLSALLFCAGLTFFYSLKRLCNNPMRSRMLLSVLLAIITASIFYAMRFVVYEVYDFCATAAGAESIFKQKALAYEKLSTLSSRTTIWSVCIKALFTKPFTFFFGEGIANSKQLILKMFGRELYTHNQFIEVAVCAGIPALLIFVAFLVLSFRNVLVVLREHSINMVYIFAALCVPVLLFANCAEALLMFYRRPGSYVFFVCCGWLCEYKALKSAKNRA